MRKLVQLLAFAALLALTAFNLPLKENPTPRRKIAVLVAVGEYPDSAGLCKTSAIQDVSGLESGFKKHGWEVYTLLGAQVTKASVYGFLDSLKIDPKQDYLFVHLGGHGFNRGGNDFFVTHDGGLDSASAHLNIPVKDLFRNACEKQAFCTLVFVDACRNSVRAGPVPPPTNTLSIPDQRYAYLIQSTGEFQFAEDRHTGVATLQLIRMLELAHEQKAANVNGDKYITVGEMFEYVRHRTESLTKKRTGVAQVPQLSTTSKLNLKIFVVQKAGKPADKNHLDSLAGASRMPEEEEPFTVEEFIDYPWHFENVRIPRQAPTDVDRALYNPQVAYVAVFVHDDRLTKSNEMLGGLFFDPSPQVQDMFHNYNPGSSIFLMAYNARIDPRVMRDLGHTDDRLLQGVVQAPSLYLYRVAGGRLFPIDHRGFMHEPDLVAWVRANCDSVATSALPPAKHGRPAHKTTARPASPVKK